MVCRALGYELQVAIVKFLKGTQATGEDAFLAGFLMIVPIYVKVSFDSIIS
jgi:cob(I)alamin adenosyltransferase